jgi:hypothetical protein
VGSLRADNREEIRNSNNRASVQQNKLNSKTGGEEIPGNNHKGHNPIKNSEAHLNSNLPQ